MANHKKIIILIGILKETARSWTQLMADLVISKYHNVGSYYGKLTLMKQLISHANLIRHFLLFDSLTFANFQTANPFASKRHPE